MRKSLIRISIEDALILAASKTLQRVAHAIGIRRSLRLAAAAGGLYFLIAKRNWISYRNLLSCFGAGRSPSEIRGIMRRNYAHLFMNIAEMLWFPRMDDAYLASHVEIEGSEVIDRCLARGKGIILLTAHFGNWELLNIVGGLKKYPMTAFARPQKHPRSDAFLNGLRGSRGAKVVYKGVSARAVIRALKDGDAVGMLADQDSGRHGVLIPFFGRLSSYPRGVVRFAARTGAGIVPAFAVRLGPDRHRIVCGPEIGIPQGVPDDEAERHVMQRFSDLLEEQVRAHPEQWLWPHRRWKSSPNRTCVILEDGKKGHFHQSRAFYEAVVKKREESGLGPSLTALETAAVRYRSRWHKKFLTLTGILTRGHFPFAWGLLRLCLAPDSYSRIDALAADYVVSCGSGCEGPNLILSKRNRARSCLIHKPQFGSGHYSVILAPKHDRLGSENVFATRGALSSFSESAEGLKSAFLRQAGVGNNGTPTLGFLVGGPGRKTAWEEAALSEAARQIKRWQPELGFRVFATSSRRTPPRSEALLKFHFEGWAGCPVLVVANESNPEGSYAGILASSDVLAVTADSVSMISEAFGTGRPVLAVIPNSEGALDRKIRDFLAGLEKTGRLKTVAAPRLGPALESLFREGTHAVEAADPDLEVLGEAAAALLTGLRVNG